MAKKTKLKKYLLSWIEVKRDSDTKPKDGERIGDDDPLWPGLWKDQNGKPSMGPSLTALFNEHSPLKLEGYEKVVFFFQTEEAPTNYLKNTIKRILENRGRSQSFGKICFQMIEGIKDPTSHEEIYSALAKWFQKPSREFTNGNASYKDPPLQLDIIASAGTPAMHATWLLLYWKGLIQLYWKEPEITFYQGIDPAYIPKDNPKPFREISNELITKGKYISTVEQPVNPETMKCRVYVEVREKIKRAAKLRLPVLLKGPRGVGKSQFAKFYHENIQNIDGKKVGNFVEIVASEHDITNNDTFRYEMFGCPEGSYTGQKKDIPGKLKEAEKGVLFIDEIHHLPIHLQVTLLRPLNGDSYNRVNAPDEALKPDFALISATNLPDDEFTKKMHPDFLDRIRSIEVQIPSFREIRDSEDGNEDIWSFMLQALKERFGRVGIKKGIEPNGPCEERLRRFLQNNEECSLAGNWRDLHKIADQILFDGSYAVDEFHWEEEELEKALKSAVSSRLDSKTNPG